MSLDPANFPQTATKSLGDTLSSMGLQRFPREADGEAQAYDAADRYILDTVAPLLPGMEGRLVVIDDTFGALTLACQAARPRVYQDSLLGRLALQANAQALGLAASGSFSLHDALDASLLAEAKLILLKLPKSLAHLEEIVDAVARHAPEDVQVVAGGMIKHMTPAMNQVLGSAFTQVQASLGRQKARLLLAKGLQRRGGTTPLYPKRLVVPELQLTLMAHGAAFAHDKLDIGTRYLASFVSHEPTACSIVDLGCGTGVLAALAARVNPQAQVIATDESAAAVASARATFAANGLTTVTALWDDAMSHLPDQSVDLILCNPPFHRGHALTVGPALRLFAAAGRVLRPGGRILVVYNHHLAYAEVLQRLVGDLRILGKNAKFTVASARRPSYAR